MRMLRFGGPALPVGTHTWFENWKGDVVRAEVGRMYPVAEVQNPDYYVDTGRGHYEGEDDGSTGRGYVLLDDLRELAARYELLPGLPETWTLEQIQAAIAAVKAEDDQSIQEAAALREASEDPVLEELPPVPPPDSIPPEEPPPPPEEPPLP